MKQTKTNTTNNFNYFLEKGCWHYIITNIQIVNGVKVFDYYRTPNEAEIIAILGNYDTPIKELVSIQDQARGNWVQDITSILSSKVFMYGDTIKLSISKMEIQNDKTEEDIFNDELELSLVNGRELTKTDINFDWLMGRVQPLIWKTKHLLEEKIEASKEILTEA